MTDGEYRSAVYDIVYLASCAVNGNAPDAGRLEKINIGRLHKAAEHHMLTGITGYALETAGVRDPLFEQSRGKALRKSVLLDAERTAVLSRLERSGIWYMPLKGVVLKELYPAAGTRQMSDNDILYDASKSGEVREIMESMGFETVELARDDSGHDCYLKPPVCNFEMHRSLFSVRSHGKFHEYYSDIRGRLIKNENDLYGYHFSDEGFYIYMIAHEFKHYSECGTGLRSLLDVYVFLKSRGGGLDWKYIGREAKKLGISEFEKKNRSLADRLFSGGSLSAEESEMLDRFVFSGVYGSPENRFSNRVNASSGGRLRYILSRLAVPFSRSNPEYHAFAEQYPFFYRHRLLLPLLPFYRLALSVRSGRFGREAKALRDAGESGGKKH